MGYTTEFDGHFVITDSHGEPTTLPTIVRRTIKELSTSEDWRKKKEDRVHSNAPDSYCQWIIKFEEDEDGEMIEVIEWDGEEKFYYYKEWLQYIINYILIPAGYTLAGNVKYKGEEFDDVGMLYIENNMVRQKTMDEIMKETIVNTPVEDKVEEYVELQRLRVENNKLKATLVERNDEINDCIAELEYYLARIKNLITNGNK